MGNIKSVEDLCEEWSEWVLSEAHFNTNENRFERPQIVQDQNYFGPTLFFAIPPDLSNEIYDYAEKVIDADIINMPMDELKLLLDEKQGILGKITQYLMDNNK